MRLLKYIVPFLTMGISAQFINNDILFVQNDGILFSETTITNNDQFTNDGTTRIEGSIINFDSIEGSGTFYLNKDWENWYHQQIDNSSVIFEGFGDEYIRGVSSEFWNIIALTPDKVEQETKVSINNSLEILQTEYSTLNDSLVITTVDPAAIIATIAPSSNGFISTDGNGKVVWNMNANQGYIIPYGSTNLSRVRPLRIEPNTSRYILSDFKNFSPSDINNRESNVKDINPNFFHHVEANENINVDVFYLDNDGEFEFVTPYESIWKNNDFGVASNLNGFNLMNNDITAYSSIIEKPIALTSKNSCIETLTISEFVSVNNDNINDYWSVTSTDSCEIDVTIFNRYGNIVFEKKKYQNEFKGKMNINSISLLNDNEILPEGTYFFIIKVDDGSKSGYFQLSK